MAMSIDDILLNINNVSFDSLVTQADIQSQKDIEFYRRQGYQIELTEKDFINKFSIDPHCIWYTPSISQPCLYFNRDTLAANAFPVDLFVHGFYDAPDVFYKSIQQREVEVSNHDYTGSIWSLPASMRLEYFNYLVPKKGKDISDLYHLFFSNYILSDYGFSSVSSDTLKTILDSKTTKDIQKTEGKLQLLPDTIKVYRGGNTASTPYEKAYSWSLDINVANFFASRRGMGTGYIVEGEVSKKDVLDVFLEDRGEQEVIVDPNNIHITREIPIHGIDFIKPILPAITPMYHKYREMMFELQFAQDSSAHGPEHEARVLLMSLTLAHILDLPQADRRVLATTAIYHDTQRVNDGVDSAHGKASRQYYQDTVKKPDPLVKFLCEYHCLPDDAAYQEIRTNRRLSKNRSGAKLLFDIFKDADALDRVRFGLRDLDLNQLRLPVSKELSLIARMYLQQVKLPERPISIKRSLTDQIQSASSKASSIAPTYTKQHEMEHS